MVVCMLIRARASTRAIGARHALQRIKAKADTHTEEG